MTPSSSSGSLGAVVADKPTGSIADAANDVNLAAIKEDIALSLAKARELIKYARARAQTVAGLYPSVEEYFRRAEAAAVQAEFGTQTALDHYPKRNPEPRNPI